MTAPPYCLTLPVEALMAEARRVTGIEMVDTDVIEPLNIMYRSYNDDANMSEKGAAFVHNYLLRMLCNRLRMQRDYAAHPEIEQEKVLPPVIICGMARTGSTKMQKLLASSGDFNWLPFWQSLNPSLYTGSRDESPRARIEDTDDYVAWINEVAPLQKATHEYATHEPEEESFIMMQCFRCLTVGTTQLTGYLGWLATQDIMSFQLKYLHQTLKYLQWQGLASSSKRWLLKAPHYFGYEQHIRDIFPEASLIMTHRHPRQTIPSVCSFLTHFNRPVSDDVLNPLIFLAGSAMQIEQHLQYRQAKTHNEFLDVYYAALNESVETVFEKVYAFCQQSLSSESRKRMLDWNNGHPIHAKGQHKYTLADFDLSQKNIDQQFSAYIDLLAQLFPDSVQSYSFDH